MTEKKRSTQVQVRLTEEEKERLDELAKASGVSASDLLRRSIQADRAETANYGAIDHAPGHVVGDRPLDGPTYKGKPLRSAKEVEEEIMRGDRGPEKREALIRATQRRDAARAKLFGSQGTRERTPCPKCSAMLDINGKCLSCGFSK